MRWLVLRVSIMWMLTGLSGLAVFFGGGKTAWFIFACLACMTLLGSWGSLAMKGQIQLERSPRTVMLHSGDTLYVEGTATLPFRFPFAFVVIHDVWRNERNQELRHGAALLLPFGRTQMNFSYTIPQLHRGIHRLDSLETLSVDFLHLSGYRERRRYDSSRSEAITVYPQIRLENTPSSLQLLRENPLSPGGIRPYMAGDSMRRIDWKAFMRRGELMTKLPDMDETVQISLILDPGSDDDQFERAVGAAAGLVEQCFRLTDAAEINIGIVSGEQQPNIAESMGSYAGLMQQLTMIRRRVDIPLSELFTQGITSNLSRGHEAHYRVFITGRLNGRVTRNVRLACEDGGFVVIYASNNRSLTNEEQLMMKDMYNNGCEFRFVPKGPLNTPLNAEVNAYG